ncbi:hypothetical protein PsorP6_006039 [Peronosclerospora sorghi]|uniref:Uncharacterized protein n=1 Tax=Peronosclerospora sorghi TaxID=230839 RepID=A0ACC0W510_9STRA|nr:hypothetical protein PsorP6_006039 [Peronosclerospora sorghi]
MFRVRYPCCAVNVTGVLSTSDNMATYRELMKKRLVAKTTTSRQYQRWRRQQSPLQGSRKCWYDVELSEKGNKEAAAVGQLLKQEGYRFDVAYTSYLKSAIHTLWHVLEQTGQMWIPVHKTWRLNERHYGALTGMDKRATVEKHGAEKVLEWRRSYSIPPPDLDTSSEYYPGNDIKYKDVPKEELPRTGSLELTATRVLPEWEKPLCLSSRQEIMCLRALVKHLDNISEDEITGLNIPTGAPLVYHLDENLKPIPHKDAIKPLTGFYLGVQDEIRARILGVKNQTKLAGTQRSYFRIYTLVSFHGIMSDFDLRKGEVSSVRSHSHFKKEACDIANGNC